VRIASESNASGAIAVIGGAAIYDLFWPLADRIELTQIHEDYPGDTFMKAPGPEWTLVAETHHEAQDGLPAFTFQTFRKGEAA
jgi:dihydrofolate reductase